MTLVPRTHWRVTDALAVVTVLAFMVVQSAGLTDQAAIMAGFIPARASNLIGAVPDVPWVPVLFTPITATLIHAGWVHLGLNSLILVFCGRNVEQVIGRTATLCLYIAGAFAAALAQWAADPSSVVPMIGASGAISALMGTYALLYSRQTVRAIGPVSANAVRMLWLAGAWIALQALIGLATRADSGLGRIAVMAHIGGFIAGLVLTRPLLRVRFGRPERR